MLRNPGEWHGRHHPTLSAAFTDHGVPKELLSDNGTAFNQARRGNISATERFLADRGCLGVTGRGSHPQTQGKNERSHQTLLRFLDANAPDSLDRLATLIADYRNYYNYRRRHQALPGSMTPGQAWEAAEHHPSDGTPISHEALQARADSYRDKSLADKAADTDNTAAVELLVGTPSLVSLLADNRTRVNELLGYIPLLAPNIEHSNDQHEAIVVAILTGDDNRAAEAMGEHLEGSAALLRGFLS